MQPARALAPHLNARPSPTHTRVRGGGRRHERHHIDILMPGAAPAHAIARAPHRAARRNARRSATAAAEPAGSLPAKRTVGRTVRKRAV